MLKEEKTGTYTDNAIRVMEKLFNSIIFDELTKYSKGENFVLKVLYKRNEPVSPTELSECLNSTKARISAILNSLEKKGFISREIDKSNRRNIIVSLTKEGKKYIVGEIEKVYNLFESYFIKIGEKDTSELIRIVNKIIE